MIRITKEQRFKLEEQFGFKVGREIQRSYSKPKRYYIVEKKYCLDALEKIKY